MRAGEHVTSTVRLVRPIASGGMGAVWVAEHLALKTEVAVKFILDGREHDADARERFSREAAAAAQVKSPHVAQIFDHGVAADGTPFIVMELLEGEDLATFLETRGRVSLGEAASIVTQVCRALARAHARGVVHRDVKPANVFLCDVGAKEPFVKLLDFGVAKFEDGDPGTATKSGSLTGTPVYMAPEQLVGARDVNYRADLWSVAIVAYELLTGRRPLTEENAAAIGIRLHTRGMPLASEGFAELTAEATRALDEWFAKAWAVSRDERFDSALEMAESFEALVRRIHELQAIAPSERLYLPPRSSARASADLVLTVREREVASAGDVTLPSGRVQVPRVPSASVSATASTAPSGLALRSPRTETPLSRSLSDPLGPTPSTAPSRGRIRARNVALVSAALAGIVAVGVAIARRGEGANGSGAASSSHAPASQHAPASAPAPSSWVTQSPEAASPAPSEAPVTSEPAAPIGSASSIAAPVVASAAPSAVVFPKKTPPKSAPSSSAKVLLDIE